MNRMNLRAAARYQIDYLLRYLLPLFAIICVGIIVVSAVVGGIFATTVSVENVTDILVAAGADEYDVAQVEQAMATTTTSPPISNFDMSGLAVVMFFIVGIVGAREDLRFFIQNGVGRRTTFWSCVIAALSTGVVIGLIGAVVNLAPEWFPISSLTAGVQVNFAMDWLLHIGAIFFAWHLGAMFSLIYYRCTKVWQMVAVSAVLGAIVLVIGPRVAFRVALFPDRLLAFFAAPGSWIALLAVMCVVVSCAGYLLMRNADIRESSD